jgi:hypothetical protein
MNLNTLFPGRAVRTCLAVLLLLSPSAFGEPSALIGWWRLDEPAPPFREGRGAGPAPAWWRSSPDVGDYAPGQHAPPEVMYRASMSPPAGSFDAGATYRVDLDQKPSILRIESDGGLVGPVSDWTLELFYRAPEVDRPERKLALVGRGDGRANTAWRLMLTQEGPVFTLFDVSGGECSIRLPDPPRGAGNLWHYVVVSIQNRELSLVLVDENRNTRVAPPVRIPDGFQVRGANAGLLLGRSSVYFDREKPDYLGTWDTFTGCLADLRITRAAVPDGELLGTVKRP